MSDERKKRSRAWIGWAAIALFCYPLSEAPVWYVTDDLDWWSVVEPAYAPADWLFENCEPFREAMRICCGPFAKVPKR
jgi:hypothetical protein